MVWCGPCWEIESVSTWSAGEEAREASGELSARRLNGGSPKSEGSVAAAEEGSQERRLDVLLSLRSRFRLISWRSAGVIQPRSSRRSAIGRSIRNPQTAHASVNCD